MEVNTAVISLERLRELELAESKLNEPRESKITVRKFLTTSYVVETDDECIKKLAEDLKDSEDQLQLLISELNKMNYWQFRKWKKA